MKPERCGCGCRKFKELEAFYIHQEIQLPEIQMEVAHARRLLSEMDSLIFILYEPRVEPTNNRAERALRFGVIWRKRNQGTNSKKGDRWVERILSLRQTS